MLKRPKGPMSSHPNLEQRGKEVKTLPRSEAHSLHARAQLATEATNLGWSMCPWFTCMALSTLCAAPSRHPEKGHPEPCVLRGT